MGNLYQFIIDPQPECFGRLGEIPLLFTTFGVTSAEVALDYLDIYDMKPET